MLIVKLWEMAECLIWKSIFAGRLYFEEKVKKKSWVQRKNFLFQFPKTHEQSVVSIYMSGICWVKKRLQMVFCVLYHLNTDYWNPWSFKKDLEIHFSFSKYYCMMTDVIQRWHCTTTLPWYRKERGINGDKKNISLLYTLSHSSPTSQRVQAYLPVHSRRILVPWAASAILNLFHIALEESAQSSALNKHPLHSSTVLFVFQASCHLPSVT